MIQVVSQKFAHQPRSPWPKTRTSAIFRDANDSFKDPGRRGRLRSEEPCLWVVSKRWWNLLIEKMLHRLSIKPSTEKFFRNEQALSTYIENTIQSYGAIPLSNISNLVMGFLLFYWDIRKGLSDVRTWTASSGTNKSPNKGHNTSKISNQRSRLGGNISKVSVRSCDSKLSNAPQPNHNNYELGKFLLISRSVDWAVTN